MRCINLRLCGAGPGSATSKMPDSRPQLRHTAMRCAASGAMARINRLVGQYFHPGRTSACMPRAKPRANRRAHKMIIARDGFSDATHTSDAKCRRPRTVGRVRGCRMPGQRAAQTASNVPIFRFVLGSSARLSPGSNFGCIAGRARFGGRRDGEIHDLPPSWQDYG